MDDCHYGGQAQCIINEGMSELQTIKDRHPRNRPCERCTTPTLDAPKDEQQPHVDRRTREVRGGKRRLHRLPTLRRLDTSDYSFGYVAGWSSGRELCRAEKLP